MVELKLPVEIRLPVLKVVILPAGGGVGGFPVPMSQLQKARLGSGSTPTEQVPIVI